MLTSELANAPIAWVELEGSSHVPSEYKHKELATWSNPIYERNVHNFVQSVNCMLFAPLPLISPKDWLGNEFGCSSSCDHS